MNENLTFLAFAVNDGEDEQFTINLFLEGLLYKQEGDKHLVMLMDLSAKDKQFKIKKHPRLIIVHEPTPTNKLNPSYIRNTLALKAETKFICHVNSDCYYSPKFASVITKELIKRPDHLILCKRSNLNEKQWKEIKSGKQHISTFYTIKKDTPHACGDCQAINRELFIKGQGYHCLIENGKSKTRDRKASFGEDTQLKHKYNKKKYDIDKGAWILHMFHRRRQSKDILLKKKKKKK